MGKKNKKKISVIDVIDDYNNFAEGIGEKIGKTIKKDTISVAKSGVKATKDTAIDLKNKAQGKNKTSVKNILLNNAGTVTDALGETKAIKTGANVATNMGKGAMKSLEGILDFANDASTAVNTNTTAAVMKLMGKSDKEIKDFKKKENENNKKFVQKDLTNKFTEKTGYNDIQKDLEKGSLVKESNLGGQISQGVGGMVPSLVAGQVLGGGTAVDSANQTLKGLKGLDLAKQVGTNVATNLAVNAAPNAVLATSAYGNALADAYNSGAKISDARKYAAGSAATEFLTEMITGGIPGLESSTGVLDNLADKGINTATKGIKNDLTRNVVKGGLNLAKTGLGEGVEEGLSAIIDPYLKNATYSKGEKVNWKDAGQEALVGGLTGILLGGAGDISNARQQYKTDVAQTQLTNIKESAKNEVINNVNSGVMTPQEGMQALQQIKNMDTNTVQQEQNNIIAEQKVQEIEAKRKSGEITTQEAQQELQAVSNVLAQRNAQINKQNKFVNNLEINKDTLQNNNQQVQQNVQQNMNKEVATNDNTNTTNNNIDTANENVVKNNNNLNEVIDEDIYKANLNDIYNQIGKDEINIDKDYGTEYEIDNQAFELKDGNTLYIETPYRYSKNSLDKIFENKIKLEILDKNNNIVDTKYIEGNNNSFSREDIMNAVKEMTYDDSNKPANGQIDIFGNVHVNEKTNMQNNAQQPISNEQNNVNNQIVQQEQNVPQMVQNEVVNGDKESKFYSNITEKSQFLNEEIRNKLQNEKDLQYYKSVSNEESLNNAVNKLGKTVEEYNDNYTNWLTNEKQMDSTDAAQGWIYLKQFQDAGDYDNVLKVAKKIKNNATKSGQYLQLLALQQRLSPEGMVRFSLNQLEQAQEAYTKKMSKEKADKYAKNFELTPEEAQRIGTTAEKLQNVNNIDTKNVTKEDIKTIINNLTLETYLNDSKYNKRIENYNDKLVNNIEKTYQNSIDNNLSETEIVLAKVSLEQQIEDAKNVQTATINKLLTDKLPPERGAGFKTWMRMSMLFNPKTQVRNVMGNTIITPVNALSDLISGGVDKIISSKTGTRTIGGPSVKGLTEYTKGMGKGLKTATRDYLLDLNTKNVEQNRYEVGTKDAKAFNENIDTGNKTIDKFRNATSRYLNNANNFLGYVMDAGDRAFYEGSVANSLYNQMKLNNTDTITPEMIEIAKQEGLQRTWNDSNRYTQAVLTIRNAMNQLNIGGYGVGDVLIPFAKTPANLTKAIVDYSPAGVLTSIAKGKELYNAYTKGESTAQLQHDFSQNLGKATAGTLLYALGYALAKAKITSGESDDDKDVKDFMQNTLGISSYSIKIGDKTFTYDWAQPIAAPLAITANYVKNENSDASVAKKIENALSTAGNILIDQSFLQGISEVFNNQNGNSVFENLFQEILDLPSRAVPTFFNQLSTLFDSGKKETFEKDDPVKSSINRAKSKTPLKSTLSNSKDTLGRDIEYSSDLFNVFLNPANVNKKKVSSAAEEIYNVYEATGDKTIMPKKVEYSITLDNGEKKTLSAKERTEIQEDSGKLIENEVNNLKYNADYQSMSNDEKAEVIKNIVNYSMQKAVESNVDGKTYKTNKNVENSGYAISDYYTSKQQESKTNKLKKEQQAQETQSIIKDIGISESDYNKYTYQINQIHADKDSNGKTIQNSRKKKVIEYINGLRLSSDQKQKLYNQYYK